MLGHKMYQTLLPRYPDTTCTVARPLGELFYKRIDLFRKDRVIDKVDAMDFPRLHEILDAERPGHIVIASA